MKMPGLCNASSTHDYGVGSVNEIWGSPEALKRKSFWLNFRVADHPRVIAPWRESKAVFAARLPLRALLCLRRLAFEQIETEDAGVPFYRSCYGLHRVKLPRDPVWVLEGNVMLTQRLVQLDAGVGYTRIRQRLGHSLQLGLIRTGQCYVI
jgi:hypothetical protein